MKSILLLLLPAILSPSIVVAQAIWVDIGNGYYVDKNNVAKRGDLSIITFMYGSTSMGGEIVFDCRRKIIVKNVTGGPTGAFSEDDSYGRAYKVACKKAWEIWK